MIEFSFKGEKAKVFKTMLDTVQSIISGPRKFDFYPDRIIMASMENSSSVFVMFDLKKEFFESYNVEDASLGLNIDDLKKILSRSINNDDDITFKYDNESNRMIITFTNRSSTSEYKTNVHVVDEENADVAGKVKAIPLANVIDLVGGSLKTILSDVGVVAQKEFKQLAVRIPDTEHLEFELKADTTGINAKTKINKIADCEIINITLADEAVPVESYYDMEYLEKLFRVDNISDSTTLELDNVHPVRITFTIDSGNAEFTYLMAPLESDDEM